MGPLIIFVLYILRYISKSYCNVSFFLLFLFLSEKTHPLHPFQLDTQVQAVVLESYLYVLGGSGNANASNKPLTLCSRWVPGIDEAVEVDVGCWLMGWIESSLGWVVHVLLEKNTWRNGAKNKMWGESKLGTHV